MTPEIRRLDAEGRSPTDIAGLLGITVQSVRNVLAGFSDEVQRPDHGPALCTLELLRAVDSPDRKWPTSELMCAFRFSTRVRHVIEHYCEWKGIGSLSLRDLFNIFVSDDASPKPGVVITPFLDIRCAGPTGLWEAIDRITALDLGVEGNLLWSTKLRRLQLGTRIKGTGRCRWTKPIRKTNFDPGKGS